jgi:hypothetical protein
MAARAPATNFTAVRLRRDIFRRSNIGLLYTGRSHAVADADASRAYGVDASIGLYTNWTINTYLAQSETPGLSGDNQSYRGQVNYNGDRYGLQAERLMMGDNFNPEVGFLRRDNFTRNFAQFRFSPRPRRSRRVRKYSYSGSYDYIAGATTGRLETREASADYGMQFQNGDSLNVGVGRYYEYLARPFAIASGVQIPVGGYGFGDVSAAMSFGNQRRIAGQVSASRGTFYSGDRTTLGFGGGRIELSPRVSLEPSMSINWVDLREGSFTTRLLSNRATFTVTPRMFFSGLLQYNSSANAYSTNVRLRWEYQPGSELFVVWTEGRNTLQPGFPFLETRGFVVKINRLFRI